MRTTVRKATFAAALLAVLSQGTLFAAQIIEIPFVPLSPAIMGQGGAFIADAHGFDSFFYNPAGYSRGPGQFTALSATEWYHSRPDLLLDQVWQMAIGSANSTSTLNFLNSQITTGGFGAGGSMGMGYVGDGFGLGVVLMVDSILFGPSLLGMTGDLTSTLGFIGGFSVPFDLLGMRVHVGADIRPMIRIHTPIPNSSAISLVNALSSGGSVASALNSTNSVYGSGLGMDLGLIAELWWFSFGISIRDLGGTTFTYSANTFGSVTDTLASQGRFPAGTSVSDTYVIPMDVGIGFSFHPDLGSTKRFVDPRFVMDFRNINGAINGTAIFWTLLHAGAEVKLLNLFTLRAGLNQGYLTAGAGVTLWALDLNAAVFTQELGTHLGDQPAAGLTFNANVRL